MAKKSRQITLMAPFENVSAKFALSKEHAGVNNGGIKYFGARKRGYSAIGEPAAVLNGFYLRKFGRDTQPSTDELNQRSAFAAARAWAQAAKRDLEAIANNQEVFMAVKAKPSLKVGGYSFVGVGGGMTGFLFSYAMRYALDHEGSVPQTHVLPQPA